MVRCLLLMSLVGVAAVAQGQHLRWRPADDQGSYRCIYGEIEVIATAPTTYFCGCNWWPSAPAGGYTGIQDIDGRKHLMIFSIWDTTADLHSAAVDRGDERAQLSRFGGEGEGGKTLLPYNWRVNTTYRYFIVKRQDDANQRTLASAYFYDDYLGRWVYDATIASPNNGDKAVKGFGGDMNAFLENFGGTYKDAPRLALYRLWVGTKPEDLVKVTDATGDGMWGAYGGSYFLASGNPRPINEFINNGPKSALGSTDHLNIPDGKLPSSLVETLKTLFSAK